jgi:alpha/beta hydrolase fold
MAIEQAYATAQWISRKGAGRGLDASRLAVAGDSVGGNMTVALPIMAKQRGDVRFGHQSRWYPVTDAAQATESYRRSPTPIPASQVDEVVLDAYTTEAGERAQIRPRRTAQPSRHSPACRQCSYSSTRPMCCATKARRTRRSCARRVSRSPRSATTASSTISWRFERHRPIARSAAHLGSIPAHGVARAPGRRRQRRASGTQMLPPMLPHAWAAGSPSARAREL